MSDQPTIVAAIVTSPQGILLGRHHDGTPPWTFIAGATEPGGSPQDTAIRECREKTGYYYSARSCATIPWYSRLFHEVHHDHAAFEEHERQPPTQRFLVECGNYVASKRVKFVSPLTSKGLRKVTVSPGSFPKWVALCSI